MKNIKHNVIANKVKQSLSKKSLRFSRNDVLISFIFCLSSLISFSQNLKGTELHNKVRLNFMPISMPTNEFPKLKPTMGLAGLHYQIPLNNWLYTGVGMKFAVTGDQGGLFTLGSDIGFNAPIFKNIYLDGNIHFGGGGGYRYLINDGGFINSNIGLQYKKSNYSFGIQYSYIDFISGKIKDNTISFFIEIPSILRFTDYKEAHKKFTVENLSIDAFWKKPAVKNAQQIRFDFFHPFGKSKKDNGSKLDETLYVLGFEYQKYLNKNHNTFIFAHTDAVYKGLRAGFMDLFVGFGLHPYQSRYMTLFTKLGIGAAGGRVAPEGGLMLYPSAGIDLKLSKNIAISGHGGYYKAITGDLEAYTIGFGLKYLGLSGGIENSSEENSYFYAHGLRIEMQNQSYFNVAKTDDVYNAKEIDLQLIGFKVNYDLNKWIYIAGEAGFAYDGRSGGYGHGLVGGGVYSPRFFKQKFRGFIEAMAGAGGGAGIDTDEGIIIRPTFGLNYDVSDKLSLSISGGRYYSPFGNVNSNNINIGLSFNLSTLSVKQ